MKSSLSKFRMRLVGLSRPSKILLVLACAILILAVVSAGTLALDPRLTAVLTHALPGFVPPWCDPDTDAVCGPLQGAAYDACIWDYCQPNP